MPLPFKLAKDRSKEELKTDVVKFEKEVSEFKELMKRNTTGAKRHGELESGLTIAKSQLDTAMKELRKMEEEKSSKRGGGSSRLRRTQRRVPRTRRRR